MAVRAEVYWNLHKGLWSLRDAKTKRVVCHGPSVILRDVDFRVQPAGRERVRREGKKNVHAYAVGFIISADRLPDDVYGDEQISYNPYVNETFVVEGTEQIVRSADYVVFTPNKEVWASQPSSQVRKHVQQSRNVRRQEEA